MPAVLPSRLNPTPMQLLCTVRNRCRQRPRNTRKPSGRYPLLGPDLHRLDRTSLRLAHLFDHLIGASNERKGKGDAKRLGCLEVDEQFDFGDLLHW